MSNEQIGVSHATKRNSRFQSDKDIFLTLWERYQAIIDEDTWILIRKSNTEDIIRISGESNNEEKCKKIINNTIEMVKEYYDKIK